MLDSLSLSYILSSFLSFSHFHSLSLFFFFTISHSFYASLLLSLSSFLFLTLKYFLFFITLFFSPCFFFPSSLLLSLDCHHAISLNSLFSFVSFCSHFRRFVLFIQQQSLYLSFSFLHILHLAFSIVIQLCWSPFLISPFTNSH